MLPHRIGVADVVVADGAVVSTGVHEGALLAMGVRRVHACFVSSWGYYTGLVSLGRYGGSPKPETLNQKTQNVSKSL